MFLPFARVLLLVIFTCMASVTSNASDVIYDGDRHEAFIAVSEGDCEKFGRIIMRKPQLLDRGNTFLHSAARHGQKKMVEYLLSKGLEVNGRDGKGETPLHEAAAEGKYEIAQLLLSRGADVNALDEAGISPLKQSEGVSSIGITRFLREHGAK